MDSTERPDDYRPGRSQCSGGKRAGMVRHGKYRRRPAPWRGLVAHSRAHALQGNQNAYTSFDRTVFWIDVPKDGVATALDILADAMMNSTLPPEEYQKEQEVIRREFAMN